MCELLTNYTRGNCAENGGVDELIVYNLENRATYTLAADGLSIDTMTMAIGKKAFQLTPDMESATAGLNGAHDRTNNSKMMTQTAMIIFKDDEDATVDICNLLLGGYFGVIAKKSTPTGAVYRHYGLVNGMTVESIEDVLGQVYEDMRGKTVNFVGKELIYAPSIGSALVDAILIPAS
tara:strand:+ start:1498 stop:2031 length:534 start_codon:yes stop_codon:yes gene_type:complete